MKVAICIPVHNAFDAVDSLLNEIDSVTPPTDIVLVNDNSDKETAERLDSFYKYRRVVAKTVVLQNEKQQLFTRSANRGIRYTVNKWGADAVVLLNTDCKLSDYWYSHLTGALKRDSRVGIAGYRDSGDTNIVKGLFGMEPGYTEVRMPAYITGHCIALRTSMLREIGVLCETDRDGRGDPALAAFHGQAHIGSERILGWKANIYGWKSVYCNMDFVEHGGGESWHRDLSWLHNFDLQPLWRDNDTLEPEIWYGGDRS